MDVQVKTATLELRTAKLNKSILKQMPTFTAQKFLELVKPENPAEIIGWVDGSVLGNDSDTWLILKLPDGTYAKYSTGPQRREKHPQIYIV